VKRSNDLIVGTVLLVSIAVIVAGALWLGRADLHRDRRRVFARFHDVGNVQVGNTVVIRGVKAGRIDAIELADDGWVRMRMVLDGQTELPRDPVVILNETSLFGEWQASIMERSAAPTNRDVQQQLDEARSKPGMLPGATLPDIAQLTAVAGRIAGDVASVAERVQVAFDDRAARELRASIRNVAELSTQLATTVRVQSRNLDNVAADVRTGIGNLNTTVAALQRTAIRIDSSTSTGEVKHIVDDVTVAAAQLREAAQELRTLSARLSRSEDQLEVVLARSDTVMQKVNGGDGSLALLINNPSLYRNSDSLLLQLRALVADIQKNPKRYVNVKVF
jgi:phospholipid/cholesterol/gamma-HCH transport system substrate-binding protein